MAVCYLLQCLELQFGLIGLCTISGTTVWANGWVSYYSIWNSSVYMGDVWIKELEWPSRGMLLGGGTWTVVSRTHGTNYSTAFWNQLNISHALWEENPAVLIVSTAASINAKWLPSDVCSLFSLSNANAYANSQSQKTGQWLDHQARLSTTELAPPPPLYFESPHCPEDSEGKQIRPSHTQTNVRGGHWKVERHIMCCREAVKPVVNDRESSSCEGQIRDPIFIELTVKPHSVV